MNKITAELTIEWIMKLEIKAALSGNEKIVVGANGWNEREINQARKKWIRECGMKRLIVVWMAGLNQNQFICGLVYLIWFSDWRNSIKE